MKKILFIFSVIALALFFYGSSVFAAGCLTLEGVTGVCKAATDVKEWELDTSGGTAGASGGLYWSDLQGGCPEAQVCVVEKGDSLCQAVAAKEGLIVNGTSTGSLPSFSTSFGCVKPDYCAMDIATRVNQVNNLCGGTELCCVKVTGTAGTPTVTKAKTSVALPDPLKGANLQTIIASLIRAIAGISGSIALAMFVYGGIKYILSAGQSKDVKDAQTILKNATFGLILIFGAYMFASSIISLLLGA